MGTRYLYIARHGAADAFGQLTPAGRSQAGLLGERLAAMPLDAIWHSPLPRAAATAAELARRLPAVPVAAAHELIDHVPYVPDAAERPPVWAGFFDGFDEAEAAEGHQLARALVARFAKPADATTHEVLITHAYQVAWLVCHALDAPPARWLGLNSANTGLTVIEYRHGQPAAIVMFNDLSHLPADLRWTGFPDGARP
ncbi:histidine phosphatase family protein [Luedemannella helvata]|uniref:Histidine phosphatase family protein n=1 Tax=Luedemannella helvata TaxID=349315 RepID=A0ABP4X131_9ACTN